MPIVTDNSNPYRFKKPAFRLLWASAIAYLFFALLRFVPPVKYLVGADKGLFIQWYPHMGVAFYYFLKACWVVQSIVGISFTVALMIFVAYTLRRQWRELALLGSTVLITLLIAETLLAVYGYHPGMYMKYPSLRQVDKLIVEKGIVADEIGITKIDTQCYSIIAKAFKEGKQDSVISAMRLWTLPKIVLKDFSDLQKGKINNALAGYYKKIAAGDNKNLSPLDSAVLSYVSDPVNSEGFRSIDFKNHHGKVRVLLLGDSYTWGLKAKNITSSFPDILLANGYEIYNTGISGADPPQYLAAAGKYIPQLNPDVVIVNFCMANDAQYFERKLRPYVPYTFPTNAGGIEACPYGMYWNSAQEAYDFLQEFCRIPQTNLFNRLCSCTRVTTQIWKGLAMMNGWEFYSPRVKTYMKVANAQLREVPPVNRQMDSIRAICDQYHAAMVLAIIPRYMPGQPLQYVKDCKNLFPDGRYYTPYDITAKDYVKTDIHFNDEGHRKYAAFLMHIIDSIEETNKVAGPGNISRQ